MDIRDKVKINGIRLGLEPERFQKVQKMVDAAISGDKKTFFEMVDFISKDTNQSRDDVIFNFIGNMYETSMILHMRESNK